METRISFITDNWLVILTHLPPKIVKRHYKTMFTPHHQHWACSQDHHSCQHPLPRDHHCMKDTLHWHLTSQRHRTKTCSSSAITISHTKATHIQTGAYCVGQCPQHHTDHPRHFMNGCHIDKTWHYCVGTRIKQPQMSNGVWTMRSSNRSVARPNQLHRWLSTSPAATSKTTRWTHGITPLAAPNPLLINVKWLQLDEVECLVDQAGQ